MLRELSSDSESYRKKNVIVIIECKVCVHVSGSVIFNIRCDFHFIAPIRGVSRMGVELDENVLMQVNSLHSDLITANQSLSWKIKAGMLDWFHPF